MEHTRVTLRIPKDLAAKAKKAVSDRQKTEYKFSMNEWIVEAILSKAEENKGDSKNER